MTELRELGGDRIEVNPDVARPPFPIWFSLPSDWSMLDTNPGTWERSAERMIDTTFRGSRLPAKERRQVMGFFEDLVADCQRAGAVLSLIRVGRLSGGGAGSAGIHLAFGDDGRPASLGRIYDMLPRSGVTEEIATGVGPAVLHRDRMTMIPPGTATVVALTSIQVFIPFPGTTWTAVLATASGTPELTEPLDALMRAVAAQVRADPDGAGTDPPGDRAAESRAPEDPAAESQAAEFAPAPEATGPGIERGFGTLIRKRIDPADGA